MNLEALLLYAWRMRVFITGGAGFIGSHLAKNYEVAGHVVTILDNFSTGSIENLKSINFAGETIKGDIRNQNVLEPLIKSSDLVLHMAAVLGVDNIMNSTLESISTNVIGSTTVLETAAKFNKRIIIASTSEIYGKNPKQPLNELDDRVIGSPQNFRWSYSDSKAIEESVARVLYLEKKLPVTTVRFFNTIGPRQSAKYGMVVPRFIASALSGRDLEVYGDGEQTRVFCHVNDAIAGVISLVDSEESIGEVFNVGGFGEISILSLAERVIQLTNSNSKIKLVPYIDAYPVGYEDMQRRVPDNSKLQKLTGWQAKINLDEAILDIAKSLTR
jgi:UDP-glucose 4-epimerase